MGLLILFRKKGDNNPFREAFHRLIELKGERIIITSGYISEGPRFSLIQTENLYSHLQIAISNGLKEIIVIAGKFNRWRYWPTKYREFLRRLRSSFPNLRIRPYKFKNWHAKVSIKILKGKPVAAIIGSSNLTSTAYGLKRNDFNRECDVVLWDNEFIKDEFYKEFPDKIEDKDSFIYLKEPEVDEPGRLERLYKEVLGQMETSEEYEI